MSNTTDLLKTGIAIEKAAGLLILVHGRGASAEDILGLADAFPVQSYAVWAPQAPGGTWYPNSFMAQPETNEPWLSQSLLRLQAIVEEAEQAGMARNRIIISGFSQGASLAQEFMARKGGRWGGLIALSGSLIGDRQYTERYVINMENTPVFIASSDPDPHIPVARVKESAACFESLGASVRCIIYPGMGHRVSKEEIDEAVKHVFTS